MTNAQFYLEDLKSKFRKIDTSEYYLSYSGGKDSHLLYWFIKEYAPEFSNIKVVGFNTYMEHQKTLKRMQENCDLILYPKLKPFEIKEKFGIPCFSKNQDEMIKRYQNGSRTKNTMNFVMGVYPIFKLNNKARELLLNNKLHKVSADCCKWLKKVPSHEFTKQTGLKPILRCKRVWGQDKKSKIYKLFY